MGEFRAARPDPYLETPKTRRSLFFKNRAPKKFKLSKTELIYKAKKFKVPRSLSKR